MAQGTTGGGVPVLRLIWPLAVLALLATVLGRMVGPAAGGVAVGIGRLVRGLEIGGAIISQLFAIGAVASAMALIGAVARSRSTYALRIGAIVAGSFIILVVLNATTRRVPGLSSALIGVGAAGLALTAAWDARRAPYARPAALVLGLVGVGAIARMIAVVLADRAVAGLTALDGLARGVATAAFALDGLAVLVATASLAQQRIGLAAPAHERDHDRAQDSADGSPAGAGGAPRLTSPLTLLALGLAFLAARQAVAGGAEDARAVDLLIRRALDRLISQPQPFVPAGVQLFVAALAVATAALSVIAPRTLPPLSGALALVLVARSAPDVPLGAIALVVAAFGVALAAHDDRALWAALVGRTARVTPAAASAGAPAEQAALPDAAEPAQAHPADAADDRR